ncbi:hypothetical protein L195_g034676, partial [Trifolium pratense]
VALTLDDPSLVLVSLLVLLLSLRGLRNKAPSLDLPLKQSIEH